MELNVVANAGCVMLTVSYKVQPFASVTTTEYVPAKIPLKSCVVVPLFQLYVYPGVPPFTVKFTAPVLFPKQSTFVNI